MKRIVSFLLALVLIVSAIPLVAISASAASNWPSLSSSSYCEFKATKNINCWRNSSCTTRGTCSPAKSYNAYISKNDVCKIIAITSSYIKVKYPTSSGERTAYIKRSDLIGVSAPSECVTSKGTATVYTNTSGTKYGSTAKGDKVYACGTSGSYTLVIYTAKSGSRAFKLGYVKTSDYSSIIKGQTSNSSSFWQWPMKQSNNGYRMTQSFNNYSSSMAKKGRPYHTGIDMVCSDKKIMAAADGTVVYRGYSSGNGNHIVLKHNFNGKTVYSLYSHLANFNGCPNTGSSVKKGTVIGTMGNTGNSSGAHLHFAIYTGYSTDPVGYASSSGSNRIKYNNSITFYNPVYVINNNRLP